MNPYPPTNPSSNQRNSSIYSNMSAQSEEERYATLYKKPGTRRQTPGSSNDIGKDRKKQQLPAKVAFVPHSPYSDLYGAVNCSSIGVSNSSSSADGDIADSTASRLKYGPTLLEIRRMKCSLYQQSNEDLDDSEEVENKEVDTQLPKQTPPSLFQHESIVVSRGLPGLGSSVASTCLDFCPSSSSVSDSNNTVRCATGLTSGALCIHTISNLYSSNESSDVDPSSTVSIYAPRQQRPSTSVAWRPYNSNLVAIGLVSGNDTTSQSSSFTTNVPKLSQSRTLASQALGLATSGVGGSSLSSGGVRGGAVGGDLDFGCLVWDIEGQSSSVSSGAGMLSPSMTSRKGTSAGGAGKSTGAAAVPIKSPIHRYAHNSGVQSLSWLSDLGQVLAVGCTKRNVQLYDMRVSGTNAPPTSVFAHTDAVAGIVPDLSCPTKSTFATFGVNVGEPVKIWDARMMESTLTEITPNNESVSSISWTRPGVLSVAIGCSIRSYDTRSPGSRSLPVGVSYLDGISTDEEDDLSSIQCLAYQPQTTQSAGPSSFDFYPHRTLAVTNQGQIQVIPESYTAPLAISKRDGRIASALGGTVWIGQKDKGPSAMDGQSIINEDISARMMRRAQCFHASQHSADAKNNVRHLLEEEKEQILAQTHLHLSQNKNASKSNEFHQTISNIIQLLQCWRWIASVESLCFDQRDNDEMENTEWPGTGLVDSGVLNLLRMTSRDVQDVNNTRMDTKSVSETLHCDVFDSPMRRSAMNVCGWRKKYGVLQDLIDKCEARGEFERAAALAVFHGDLSACVSALYRGAVDVRKLVEEGSSEKGEVQDKHLQSYSETLSLIAMCVSGFNVTASTDGKKKTTPLWSNACDNLLRRSDITMDSDSLQVSYLRAILVFLQSIGSDDGFNKTINDEGLSLADRVAVACQFLPRASLKSFLESSLSKCIKHGNLEGLLITGLNEQGIELIQSYTDKTSDVQSAALISCRAVLPAKWTSERRMCSEWLESYRLFLNGLQMFMSRAAFDVGRFDHLRRIKQIGGSGRQSPSIKKQQLKSTQANNFPPQLWARCNYCNASLPLSKLRRQEGIANSWLSRQKPVLTCCPQCKKPLPRCSICLLSLGALNPYMELQRERNQQYPRNGMTGGSGNIQGIEDLSGLASLPFESFFSWCMRCKHGGHAHHLRGWFEKHSSCPVSGCDCQCQFDGIQNVCRPAQK